MWGSYFTQSELNYSIRYGFAFNALVASSRKLLGFPKEPIDFHKEEAMLTSCRAGGLCRRASASAESGG